MCHQNVHNMPNANGFYCSNLGVSALRNEINNYLVSKRTEDSYENSNSGR